MRQHEGEWLRLIQAAHVGQLHEKQERGRGVLEAGEHRVRRKPDHGADFDEAEERLEDSAEENRREEHQQDGGDAGGVQHSRFRVDQAVEKRPEEKRAVDTRRVNRRRSIPKKDADNGYEECSGEAGQCAVGKIFVAQGYKGEHSVSHRQRNCDGGGDQPADDLIADV